MFQDMRLGLRRVLGTPGFSIAVTLILGIGIGAATAMGSVLYALAWKPLDLPNPATLVAVSSVDERALTTNTPLSAVQHLRDATLGTGHWCAYNSTIEATESGGRVLQSRPELLSGDCAEVLGVAPVLGRWFTAEEAPLTGTAKPVVVISDHYWQRMFDRAPDVLGRSIRIRDVSVTVIGVMPAQYQGLSRDLASDFIIPFNAHRPSSGGFMFLGRLQRGGSLGRLAEQARTLWPSVLDDVLPPGPARANSLKQLRAEAQAIPSGFSTLRRLYAAPVQRFTLLALALLALVCINVGGLMVSRIASRFHEISAMRAIGASTARIVVPLATECGVVAVAGALTAVPLAFAASTAFAQLLPTGNMPWTMSTRTEPIVLAGVGAGVIVMTLVIAALPMWLAARRSPQLRTDRGASRSSSRWAQGMLVAQIGVTVALVFTCGLVVRSFYRLQTADRGFITDNLLSLRLAANPAGYAGMDAPSYYRALVEKVSQVPGVQSVGLARYFGTINAQLTESPIGFVESVENAATGANEFVSPAFFSTLGVPILAGREFEWTDVPASEPVTVVSDSLARLLDPDANVIGRVIRYGTMPAYSQLRIVGVAGNISIGNVRKNKERMLYLSSIQTGETAFASMHIRTAGAPLLLVQPTTMAVAQMGREHVIGAYSEMLFGNSMTAERMGTAVSGIVAILALIISAIGIFALVQHTVERRTREIGIRIAIGASPRAVSRLILGQAAILVTLGVGLGIPTAFGSTSLITALLYEVSANDTVTLMVSIGVLMVVALLAALRPTRRAIRIDPTVALRTE
jgi:predicted permease